MAKPLPTPAPGRCAFNALISAIAAAQRDRDYKRHGLLAQIGVSLGEARLKWTHARAAYPDDPVLKALQGVFDDPVAVDDSKSPCTPSFKEPHRG